MIITEPIEDLNNRLIEHYGIDTSTSQPIWRIVFSDDQFENRFGLYDDITSEGIFLRSVKETRYVPKYRQWIQHKYVLEQLVAVPSLNAFELPCTKVSYEPLYVYEDGNDNPLPPKWEPTKFIIDNLNAAKHRKSYMRYKDPESSHEEYLETEKQKISKIQEELFGDESGLLGTTINCGQSAIVPQNYEKRK